MVDDKQSRHAPTRELRGLLDGMRLKPAPMVFEVDMRGTCTENQANRFY